MFIKEIFFVVLVVTVQFSNQRPSVSNSWPQGRHRRNIDAITAAPLSEEEFRQSLNQGNFKIYKFLVELQYYYIL